MVGWVSHSLKPITDTNTVFLGSRDENHTITPVFKVCDRSLKRMLKADIILVGDFGQAEFVVPIQKLGKDYFEYDAASYDMNGTTRTWRGTKGTASYHPPVCLPPLTVCDSC